MNYEKTKEMIKRHEGERLKPYKCSAGKLTIGVGRNLEDVGISAVESDYLFSGDLQNSIIEARKLPFFKDLSETRKSVIVDMIFNLGLPRFLRFKKMIEAITRKDYNAAAFEMLNSKWAAQVGYRAEELADMMRLDRFLK